MKKWFFAISVVLVLPLISEAYDDCPKGVTDSSCEYPGDCGRYVDEDNDQICDHSQPAPEKNSQPENLPFPDTKNPTENSVENSQIENSNPIEDFNNSKKVENLPENSQTNFSKTNLKTEQEISENTNSIQKTLPENNSKKNKTEYPLIFLSVVTLLAYFTTYFLSVKKVIFLVTHRKIWNVILAISFLMSAISGIILVLQINFGWNWSFPFNSLYLHVVTGIVATIVSVFHIAWHWRYYVTIFKK